MEFDLDKDLEIFDQLFAKRPEVTRAGLKQDLQKYYLPYVERLIALKKAKSPTDGLIVGVSAIQGAGKTTQGEILEILLSHFGYSSVSRSIDDHYITHQQLVELRNKDPRFIRRGVTHDIPLAIQDLQDLEKMTDGQPILVSGYDKGAQHGDGDRFRWVNMQPGLVAKAKVVVGSLTINKEVQQVKALQLTSLTYHDQTLPLPERMGSDIPILEHFLPHSLVAFLSQQGSFELTISESADGIVTFTSTTPVSVANKDLPNGWRLITKKPDFIFYDGWMLGARPVEDESVFDANLPALETPEAKQFAKDVNKKLADYEPLWQLFEFMTVLYVVDYQISLQWRDQAEEALRAKGEGMSHEEIKEFVHYFWRCVHPGIHIKNLATSLEHTQLVAIIQDNHLVGEVLTPAEVARKYS